VLLLCSADLLQPHVNERTAATRIVISELPVGGSLLRNKLAAMSVMLREEPTLTGSGCRPFPVNVLIFRHKEFRKSIN